MKFEQPLIEAILIKRYKRFLADVELDNGNIVTVHTANTGAMTGCCTPGSRIWLSRSDNPKRKYALSWELVEVKPGIIAGINTALPNKLVYEAIEQHVISELNGYEKIRREVAYGEENSRIDLLLEDENGRLCYVEIKNVTLVENKTAFFPDAVSKRGSKHLRELIEMHRQGHRSVIFYCVQRKDAEQVSPADSIDPEYGQTLRLALQSGVEALAYRANVSPEEVYLQTRLAVLV
jgi:sugar fermentation stimulation protein A